MSSLDHQSHDTTEQYSKTSQLSFPDTGAQKVAVEQIAFPKYSALAHNSLAQNAPAMDSESMSPSPTEALRNSAPVNTRALTEVQTDAFSIVPLQQKTTTLRQPVIIRATGRKTTSLRPPVSRRRPIMHVFVTVVLALVVLSALFAVIPVGKNGQSTLLKSLIGANTGQMNFTGIKGDNAPLIIQQAATATAVTTDGFDAGSQVYAGVPTAPPGMGNGTGNTGGAVGVGSTGLNRFFYGQCTYWANMRYAALTGHQVAWLGNAYEWAAGASSAGWVVSSTPHIHSIIVLQPYVQQAGGFGHVAVVESIPSPGVVSTSNWNWSGNWGITTYVNFTYPMAGVSFVWYPGAN